MRKVLSIAIVAVMASCGGQNRASKRVVPYEPELLELCIEDSGSFVEQVCEHPKNEKGKRVWVQPSSKSKEMLVFLRVNAIDSVAARSLAGNLISRGDTSNDKQISCEGQVARYERGLASYEKKRYRDAFLDFAYIVKSGPKHYKYSEMPVLLKKMRPLMASGTVSTCLAEFYNRR